MLLHTDRLLIFLVVSFLILVPCAFGQQSSAATRLQLQQLEIDGLKRYVKDQIVEASGLKIGQTVSEAILDEAANRLVQTGFFTSVSYRMRTTGAKAVVTFKVEEKADKGLPVVFENFVWFTDEELSNVIRREIPSYDGTALEAGNATDNIKAILQRFRQEKNILGQVEYLPYSDPTGAESALVYTIKGLKIPICDVSFTGMSAIKEEELKVHSKPLINDDFTRGLIVGFANVTLGDIYRERGYLRALFTGAPVKTLNDATCKNGVLARLTVDEGLQYSWEKAEWIDNKALGAQELDTVLGMKNGEVANIKKINKGLFHAGKEFGTKGYIAASLRPTREFDDANKRVTFRIKVIEGAQYKMGALSFTGVSEETAARLRSQWKLLPGSVFDSSYARVFSSTVLATDRTLAAERAGKRTEIDASMKPNRQTLTVDVTINLK